MLAEGPPFGSPSVNMQKAEESLEISAFLVFFVLASKSGTHRGAGGLNKKSIS